MCSDPDSYMVPVANADWNIAKACVMSYIITHSVIMLQIAECKSMFYFDKCSIERGDFPLFARL